MRTSAGMWMPRRTPRRPSIGFCSRSASTASSSAALRQLAASPRVRAGGQSAPAMRWRVSSSVTSREQIVVAGQEFVQRRIDQPDGHRQPVHRLEQPGEVARAASAAAARGTRRARRRPAPGSSAARSAAARSRRTCARCASGRCPARRSGARARRRPDSRHWPTRRAGGRRRPRPAASAAADRRTRAPWSAAAAKTSPVVPSIDTASPSRSARPANRHARGRIDVIS